MGQRGPAPKPRALKILAGNPGKRPIPPEVEFTGTANAPESLPASAKAYFDHFLGLLAPKQLATPADASALVDLCRWLAAGDSLWKKWERTKDGKLIAKLAAVTDHCNKLRARFGLTPAERSKVPVIGDSKAGVWSRKRA